MPKEAVISAVPMEKEDASPFVPAVLLMPATAPFDEDHTTLSVISAVVPLV